jgi:hypothetical protein
MKFWIALLCFILLILSAPDADAIFAASPDPATEVRQDSSTVQSQGYRSGRGSFSGVRTPTTNRGGVATNPGAPNNAVRNPAASNPTGSIGRGWGGMLGGLALGTMLGSLFNPFGFMGFGPGAGTSFSFIGLLFWGAVIYLIYRFFRRSRKQTP